MDFNKLKNIIEELSGSKIDLSSDQSLREYQVLTEIFSKIELKHFRIDYEQFNEIMLLFNKDIISRGFFDFFFLREDTKKHNRKTINFEEIEKGVDKFRKYAMLVFGNFHFPYKKLSKLSYNAIEEELKEYLKSSNELIRKFNNRPPKLTEVKKIGVNDIPLLGYISRGGMIRDLNIVTQIQEAIKRYNPKKNKQKLCDFIVSYVRKNKSRLEVSQTKKILKIFFSQSDDKNKFKEFIIDSLVKINAINQTRLKTEAVGKLNSDIYLVSDEIDVYLATSMRKEWDYQSFHSFGEKLFSNNKIRCLKLRYFDPTQSSEESRIDKGLIEGLMLKRAKCTIYTVQESDTFGKDSELAVTLAQGKPVIAFVPKIEVIKHAKDLEKQPLELFIYKMNWLYDTFNKPDVRDKCLQWLKNAKIGNSLRIKNENELERFINDFIDKITRHVSEKVWSSIDTPWAKDEDFKRRNRKEFKAFCHFLAIMDSFFYDGREKMLKEDHPLGLQINLKNGVANGVLVVRDINRCVNLLYSILTNRFLNQLYLKHEVSEKCWTLREKISGCVYRVVTDNPKLTNSFWNLYLTNTKEKEVV